jgi:hypothetical protein
MSESPPPDGAFQCGKLDGRGVRLIQIQDGLSNTFLAGEKHVPLGDFGEGGWDCSIYNGDHWYCSTRSAGVDFPLAESIRDPNWRFGSYHPAVVQFVFGDGSVHGLRVGIDPLILQYLANINDGQVLPPYE